ncbi:protein unc-45 homolog B-like [Corticium candelabrum]|uniref:protein unc-45 homolog B-like n=1 Tax=Corticium candelabrum TaxID=121492 RepID=UPI002E264D33|nr:protein unc-45 homolog B-like [Corticium candelabrum]
MALSEDTVLSLKEKGNQMFAAGQYVEAAETYSRALKRCEKGDETAQTLHKNRAACYLKLERYGDAVADTTAVLTIAPNDIKSLFRRSQALEKLGKTEDAYKDIKTLLYIDPKNREGIAAGRRLMIALSSKAELQSTTDGKVSEAMKILLGSEQSQQDKVKAAKMLAVLAQQEAGAEQIFRIDGVAKFLPQLNGDNAELALPLLLVLAHLCDGHQSRASAVLNQVTTDTLSSLLRSSNSDVSKRTAFVLHRSLTSAVSEDKREHRGSKQAVVVVSAADIKDILQLVLDRLGDPCVCVEGRDGLMEVIIKSSAASSQVAVMFIQLRGVERLLQVAECTHYVKQGSATAPEDGARVLPVGQSTRLQVSVALAKLYENCGDQKNLFKETCASYVSEGVQQETGEAMLAVMSALSALLQGIPEIGGNVFGNAEVLSKMIQLAQSDDSTAKRVAAEAMAHAASDKTRCTAILGEGFEVLKELYKSKDDAIRVRALVGLCRLSSIGEGNTNDRPLAEGSTLRLYKAARKYLVEEKKDVELQKWAAEGVAFLVIDADVKEALVDDEKALESLLDLAKIGDQTVVFGIASMLVSLTNSYDKPQLDPEMEELGKYAQQNLPTPHEKDADEYVKKRIEKLMKAGVIVALAHLAGNTESAVSREMLSRVFLALVNDQKHRGMVIQLGGAKALLPMALEGTEKGKHFAAQAVAKIAITADPRMAFPGQRVLETVRPLVQLLKSEHGLQQFEALMALTNLSSLDADVRNRIVKEKGIQYIESLQFEDHELLRRAATECMCNMVMNEEVFEMYVKDSPTERVKLMTLFAGEEDFELARAASGALAMLTTNKRICEKMMEVRPCLEVLQQLLCSDKNELQYRGVYIVYNMINNSKEIAEKLIENNGLEILMALSQESVVSDETKLWTGKTLDRLVDWGLIQPAQSSSTS